MHTGQREKERERERDRERKREREDEGNTERGWSLSASKLTLSIVLFEL